MKPYLRIAAAVLPIVLTGCREETATAEKAPVPVHVDAASMFTPETGRRYSASIAPYRQVSLSFKSGGFVESILQVHGVDGKPRNVGPGDQVTAGEILARVRRRDYDLKVNQAEAQLGEARKSESAARAQLAVAEAAAAKAGLDFGRAADLFATHSITKPDYDAATAQRDTTQAQVDAARSQIEASAARIQMAQAGEGDANLARSDTELIVPFAGFVVLKQVEVGTLVGVGSPGFTIADLDSVKAVFGLPDIEVASLKTGATLSLTTDALPGREFRGIATSVSPVADSNTRLFPIEVTVSNAQHTLLAGMIASVAPGATRRQPVLVVPLGAVVHANKEGAAFGVIVVDETGGVAHARVRTVALGETFGNRIQILRGLRDGERVVTSGAALLTDGEAVRVVR